MQQQVGSRLPNCRSVHAGRRLQCRHRCTSPWHEAARIGVVGVTIRHDQWGAGAHRVGSNGEVVPIGLAIKSHSHRVHPPHRERLRSVEFGGTAGVEPSVAQLGGEPLCPVDQDVAIARVNKVLRDG